MKSVLITIALSASFAAVAADPVEKTFTASIDGSEEKYIEIDYSDGNGTEVLFALHGHGSDRNQFAYDGRGECAAARKAAEERRMIYVSPDYRACTSWMGPKAESDMLDLIRCYKDERGVKRVFMSGASMGACSTMTFTSLHPELIDGIVVMNGMCDFNAYGNFLDAIAESFGGTRDEIRDEYIRRSAIYNKDVFTMPCAFTFGLKDELVPPASGIMLAEHIKAVHPDICYIDTDPDRGHETDYTSALAAYREMFQRFDAKSGGEVEIAVSFGGEPVEPSFGSLAGIWYYEKDDAQMLLLGFSSRADWRSIAVGDGWELNGRPLADWTDGDGIIRRALHPARQKFDNGPVACSAPLDDRIADALIEWDWRMHDGIGTPKEQRPIMTAIKRLRARAEKMGFSLPATGDEAEYLALHRAIREKTFEGFDTPILFAKFVPGGMSHQLTQSLGYCSRPGGGLFVLDRPGRDMKPRDITPKNLPAGSFMNPELSADAEKVLFAYADVFESPPGTYTGDWENGGIRFCTDERMKIHYNIYESSIYGGEARRLTDDGHDDMFPIYLADGDIVFSSTRRGGYHRCGMGPCPVFTTSRMGPNGENPHSLSVHETHEWTPVVMDDGRLLYSRWDYVDRNGVLYQQLWTSRPDGGGVRIYYGNNTWNPCGTWEARPVPGSTKVMAIAGPHHGQAAGSVILIDINDGIDYLDPIKRLTPEVRFAESEFWVLNGCPRMKDLTVDYQSYMSWSGSLVDPNREVNPPEEENRWYGHCYKAPWPLSETRFIASYSFDPLFGEPGANFPNMFGIYLCDTETGARELIYRDPRICSVWARPVAKRVIPPSAASSIDADAAERGVGTYFLADVADAWPERLPADRPIKALRLFKILEKTTPNADQPKVAIGQGALGREVLGTVPVEDDGSAFFEVPAKTPVYFQALDESGRAVQTMRSLVYLQSGERESCVGCHENRQGAMKPAMKTLKAQLKPPAKVEPCTLPGARPFNYLKLVQPVLDAKCVRCHDGSKENCPALTGEAEGWACRSFNTLINFVPFSSWGQEPRHNDEPLTLPLTFGAIPAKLSEMLDAKHGGVELTDEERARLDLWMDSNGACWGTFDWDKQRDL